MANRYAQLREKQQKEVNEFPLGFAFSTKQFEEMMKGWGLNPKKDTDKICSIGAGGYIRKTDSDAYCKLMIRLAKEVETAIDEDQDGTGFVYEMFLYELDNHEYGYTGELEDTLDSLGISWEELEKSEKLKTGLKKAQKVIRGRKDS